MVTAKNRVLTSSLEKWWFEINGFWEVVLKWSNEFEVIGCPDYVFNLKLRLLKKKIADRRKSVCGESVTKKRNFPAELVDIGLAQGTRALNEDKMMVRATVLVEFEKIDKK